MLANKSGLPAGDERDNQQMLSPFDCPINGQAHFPGVGKLPQGLIEPCGG